MVEALGLVEPALQVMQHRQGRERIDGELVISLLEESERVGQPRVQPVEPADIEIDTSAGATHPAEQSPVGDSNGISLRRVE